MEAQEEFDAALGRAMEVGKINGLLPMVDVKTMMRIRAVVERFIEQVKYSPTKGNDYPSINWGDFRLVFVGKVIPLSGEPYYSVLCEEGDCDRMIQDIYAEVMSKLGIEIEVRVEW